MLFSQYPYLNFSDYNLDWIIKMVNELLPRVESLEGWKAEHELEYDELKAFCDAIESGNFPDAMMRSFYDWCRRNVPKILSWAVRSVFFGLTDDGHFFAWIPDGWDEIVFNTTEYDISLPLCPEYGHLVLSAEITEVVT